MAAIKVVDIRAVISGQEKPGAWCTDKTRNCKFIGWIVLRVLAEFPEAAGRKLTPGTLRPMETSSSRVGADPRRLPFIGRSGSVAPIKV